ncbi:ATP-binding protein [Herbidospora sp. RD11066]
MDSSVPSVRAGGDLRLQILGPLRVWRDGVELDTGPRQQTHLLALLLARAGRPIGTSELIDLIWGPDAPASALNILQKYVGGVRRVLEPELPARSPGRYLQRRGSGYLFAAAPGMLDLVTFRELVEAAKACLVEKRFDDALDRYAEALPLWQGAAGGGLANATVTSIFSALDGEFFDACVAAAELAVSRRQAERVLQPLRLAAGIGPLHEAVQAGLVSALTVADRQAEALEVLRAVRVRLAEELGIDPGPELLAAHQRILSPAVPRSDSTISPGPPPADGLVGRADELAVLRQGVGSALAGETGLAIVEGEPGVGKTRLVEEACAEGRRRGAMVVWGRCLEGDGTPSMWPWVQVVGAFLDGLPDAAREEWHAGELGRLAGPRGGVPETPVLPDGGAQFRLFEQAVALVGRVSARRPVVLVVDDLQWADAASLDLFGHLAARLPGGTVVIGALRDRAPTPGPELARMLAAASRVPRHRRIRLGPLGPSEVAELVRRETGRTPGPDAAQGIHARTAGNPFFVRELSRLLGDGDALARVGLPTTVRDVVQDRIAVLDDDATDLLQIAALIGRDVDLALLARAADIDGPTCLDRLEPLEALGLLGPMPDDPYSNRFAHDLVRESVIDITSRWRATQLHLRIADALEHPAEDDEPLAERLAHHLRAAGPLVEPARTVDALMRAGRHAANKSAYEAAERHLRSAAHLARTAGLAELELSALSQLTVVVGRSGYVGLAREPLERAEQLARELGREREATGFLLSLWVSYSQGIELDRAGRLARRLLDQGEASADPTLRVYGWNAWGFHQWDLGNIGEAFRHLTRADPAVLEQMAQSERDPLRRDLWLLWPVMHALMTALHGDVDTARALLDAMEADAGDDPYVITVWASFAVTVAALAGDPVWALRAAERGIALDPDFSFVWLGSYQRLARCWARAVTGENPAEAATEADRLIAVALADPPRSGLATWSALLGEMWLAAGRLDEAAAALDRADSYLDTYGQRYAEGLVLLLRARLLRARGADPAAVREAAERARALSTEREAYLFAHRAERLLACPAEAPTVR